MNNAYANIDYVISVYTPISGIASYKNESGSVDEDDSSITANEVSYLFKVNYHIIESFSMGIESGRFSYNGTFSADTNFTNSYKTDESLGLVFNYINDKHTFSLIIANTKLSSGTKYYDNNIIDGLVEYTFKFKENSAVNLRYMNVEGWSNETDEIHVQNSILFLGFSFYL